jgi:hypothetical protein
MNGRGAFREGINRSGKPGIVKERRSYTMKILRISNGKSRMKSKNALCGLAMAVVLQLGVLAGSAQTIKYLFTGSETNITLPPGTYIITAYGAPGAYPSLIWAPLGGWGGSGAEMSAEFNFSTSTTLTLLVGGGGYGGSGKSGGGGSFIVEGSTPLVIAGGGGGPGFSAHPGGNGNVSTNGGRGNLPLGGPGGTGGGGGGGAPAEGGVGGGGGGGGFLGNGGGGGNSGLGSIGGGGGGGSSFETGGRGGNGGSGIDGTGGPGGYGGGGGGGGSIIDSSAITNLAEVSGITGPTTQPMARLLLPQFPSRFFPSKLRRSSSPTPTTC